MSPGLRFEHPFEPSRFAVAGIAFEETGRLQWRHRFRFELNSILAFHSARGATEGTCIPGLRLSQRRITATSKGKINHQG